MQRIHEDAGMIPRNTQEVDNKMYWQEKLLASANENRSLALTFVHSGLSDAEINSVMAIKSISSPMRMFHGVDLSCRIGGCWETEI